MIKKILVSQPKPSSDKSPYYDIATDLGVELVFRPFFKVEGSRRKSSVSRRSTRWTIQQWYSPPVMP